MHELGGFFAKPRPFLPGEFVTTDSGTGLVHMAPDHGEDDFELCKKYAPELGTPELPLLPVFAVQADGRYRGDWLWPDDKSLSVINTKLNAIDGPICRDLRFEADDLLSASDVRHSYPHSWRSKAKVIYRCTPQWFTAMDKLLDEKSCRWFFESRWENEGGALLETPLERRPKRSLRQVALHAIADTRFVPEKGRNRLQAMVEGRPDWVISRQRAWGVPIALFVDKASGEPLVDPNVNQRIVAAISEQGVDAWDPANAAEFLGPRNPDDYEMVGDILDVWFDSGCTHVFTLESGHWPDQRWPADLYLEGSDQHRGWFQSSLLESSGTRGRAPYDAILTHGFTMDENGEKMSKSKGNVVDPEVVIRESGAEIIRLWAAMIDYSDDSRIGKTVLQTTSDAYRKLRNTVRYMLGALADYSPDEAVELGEMPPLERFILHRLWELDGQVRAAYEGYLFQDVIRPVTEFCQNELSALFFDIRRDALYCDRPDSVRRRAARTVMDAVFERVTAWLAPLIPFTMEEAWTTRYPGAHSNCLRVIPDTPAAWRNDAEAQRWAKVQAVTSVVTGALEIERREKRLGAALEAAPAVHVADAGLMAAFDGLDPAEVFRTSQATLAADEGPASAFRLADVGGVAVEPLRAEGRKCARSWRILPEVGSDPRYPDLSLRDADAVAAWDATHRKALA
jgi:isoleucyl-tRNA synthetase